MNTALAITGIHTDIGKTFCAAVLTQALQCDYWKPIQAGTLTCSDSYIVKQLLSNPRSRVFKEVYSLNTAASPHLAAQLDNIDITLASLKAPSNEPLLIETAGGIMSPVNSQHTVADLLMYQKWATIVVIQHYLGSVSHTLSAIESLKSRHINIIGLLINGDNNESSESFIKHYTELPILAHIPYISEPSSAQVKKIATSIRAKLHPSLAPWRVT